MTDDLILRDEKLFFQVVRSTPDDVEASDVLRRARARVVEEKAILCAYGETGTDQAKAALLVRLNNEIQYVEDRRNRLRLWNAIKALWGEEGTNRVKLWLEQERSKEGT